MDADQVAHMLGLEGKLDKIRQQIHSKLENQKHIAIILTAVEDNIKDHDTNDTSKNIVNYMISFMSLLDQALDPETHSIKDLQLATSTTYLLDIVFQYTPKKLLRTKFAELLTKIAPCITDEKAEALLIRSAVGCLESLLIAQDAQAWNNTYNLTVTPTRGLQGLLELSLDPRPKIRKRSLEAINKILSNPPVAPTAEHVAACTISIFAIKHLSDILNELNGLSNNQLKNQTVKEEINSSIIRSLRLISTIITTGQWPSTQIEPLCDMLLDVTKSSEQYLVSTSFECFAKLFNSMAESSISAGLAEDKYIKVLDTIFQLKPSNSDTHLAGSWIAVVVKGMSTYAVGSPIHAIRKVPEVFKLMSNYLQSETKEISFSASQCLIAILSEAIKDDILLFPQQSQGSVTEKDSNIVADVIAQLSKLFGEFLTIKYTNCTKEILSILAAAFKKFRFRSYPSLEKPLRIVDSWRVNEKQGIMELIPEIDSVIGSAISAIGPEVVLKILPLNINNEYADQPGRAWMLPLLRDYTRNAKLSTFITDLLPLVKDFESKFDSFPKESVQLRIYETIVAQIWSTLSHFAELPSDLRESFTDNFASELCSLLYSNIDLRTTICHTLKMIVESNIMYSEGALNDDIILQSTFPVEESKQNLEYLSSKAVNILSVLFNVYTQTASNSRGYILETIESYLKIISPEDLEKTFNNVCGLLKNAMDRESASDKSNNNNDKPQLTATLLDIVVAMVTYLPANCYGPLFMIFDQTVNSADTLIQKRAYRIISKLSEISLGEDAIANYLTEIETILLRNSNSVHTSARSGRLSAIKTVVNILPPDHMSFIVQISAEIILATKDVNEKTRDLAFEILILMGERMNNGGRIDMGDGNMQVASLSEYFKVISAGLIGESQHMVSSTITAFACLMFEFKESLSADVIIDLYDTVELYLTSNSREIAKSAIGFAKVCVLGLPEEMMKPKVPELIPKLLRWSHEHTGHFKARVKHIIERLIRRFGYEYVEANFPEEDLKLLTNIRKTRNRNKRKDNEGDNEGSTLPSSKGPKFMSAFDEAVYASDEDENDEMNDNDDSALSKNKQYIIEKAGENPLDLLDADTLAHISSTRPKKYKKDQKKRLLKDDAFSFDDEGKLVVKNKNATDNADDEDPIKSMTSGINAYLEAVKTGPVRGQRNKLKFKKGNRDDDGFSDEEKMPKKNVGRNKIGKNSKKSNNKFKSRRKL